MLTKKYRLLYKGKTILFNPYFEYPKGSKTLIGENVTGVDFDSLEELSEYKIDKKLSYDEYTTVNNE